MRQQNGNFLLQALLALTLIFAFIPFIANRLAGQNADARMHATTRQVELAQTAARIFIRENTNNIAFDTTVVAGDAFADMLEPYGLPLGFVPRTALGQDMSLVLHKTPMAVSAYIELSGGDLSGIERAELARRIGFYATQTDDTIQIGIELQDIYSDIVRRNEPNLDNSGFLIDLDMGENSFRRGGNLFAQRGEFESAQFGTLSVMGTESGRKTRSTIENMTAEKTVFQSKTGESALSLTRGTLFANNANFRTVSKFGDTGNLVANNASVYDFSMTAGRTGFTGGAKWNVRGNVVTDNINLSVERLDVSSYINATRGQDVYVNYDDLEVSAKSGLEVGYLYTSNITLYDQTSSGLNSGKTGQVILDIRPAGTSLLPDAYVTTINNDAFKIIKNVTDDSGDTIGCGDIIKELDGVYNKNSLSQYIICQYVYWQRLEQRINMKQCLMAGGSDCVKK